MTEFLDQETIEASVLKVLFVIFAAISVSCHFTVIVLASLFTSILRVSARHSDTWRIILNNGMLPSVVDAIITIGNFAIALLLGISIMPQYGIISGIVFGIVAVFCCGVIMHIYNSCWLHPSGHPVHGWLKLRYDEFDLTVPFGFIQAAAEYDLSQRNHRDVNVAVHK